MPSFQLHADLAAKDLKATAQSLDELINHRFMLQAHYVEPYI